MKIKVDPEFKMLIPSLSKDEYEALVESIMAEDVREPIRVWDGTIVDGHNRYEIATRIDAHYTVEKMVFFNREEAMLWMIDNQRGRRNLTKAQLLALGEKRTLLLTTKAKEKQIAGGKATHSNQHSQGFQKSEKAATPKIDTTKELAKFADVSIDTASRYKTIMKEAPEEIKQEVKDGSKSINKAYNEIKSVNTKIKLDKIAESVQDILEENDVIDADWGAEIALQLIEIISEKVKFVEPQIKKITLEKLNEWIKGEI